MSSRPIAVAREAWYSARSQPVASAVTILVVIGMVLTVMLTTGRTVGAEQRVLGTIDAAGTRMILVRADPGAGLTSQVLQRIEAVEGIEWSAAFSSAVDATNSAIPDGQRAPVRLAYGPNLHELGVPTSSTFPGSEVYASSQSLETLGLDDVAGSVTTTTGAQYSVVGEILTPDFLADFEPLLIAPQPVVDGTEAISVLIVIAETPNLVAPVSAAVVSVLSVEDPTKVSVQTSESLAQLRAIVQSQLGSFSRGLVLVILGITGLLVALVLYALVVMRRKDFGRRRALGASRGLIVGLILTQTVLLSGLGVAIGLSVSTLALTVTGDPLPGAPFITALAVLAMSVGVVAALVPAMIASSREPIRELRVP